MSGPSNGQTAQSSTFSHASNRSSSSLNRFNHASTDTANGESSFAASRGSGSNRLRDINTADDGLDGTDRPESAVETFLEHGDGKGGGRHRPRKSGGFLLDSTHPSPGSSNLSGLRSRQGQNDIKGKRKSDDSDLVVQKRRSTRRHQHRQSLGSSPLATAVTNVSGSDDARNSATYASQTGQRRSFLSESIHSGSNTLGDGSSAEAATRTSEDHQSPSQASAPSIGFDTDPAQIVNLALNLSESRRRNFSGGRLVSGETAVGRRIASAAPGSTVLRDGQPLVRQGGSLRQHLMSQRRNSRNVSPGSIQARRVGTASPRLNGTSMSGPSALSRNVTPADLDVDDDDMLYDVSDATLARVEKARKHFELFFEYRRLLSHLPPLRHSSHASPTGTKPKSETHGRAYNPLQYVRNRKVRFREKNPINGEADGWNDIEKVQEWVGAVLGDHNQPRHDPDECIRLPQLQDKKEEVEIEEEDDASPASSIRRPNGNANTKPRRPRLDWITTPPDLLADAFWLEQGLNKTKIEDSEGNKIYPWDTEFKWTGWRNRTPAVAELPIQPKATETLEQVESRPELPTFKASTVRDGFNNDRGRRRHKLRSSIHSLHSQSGSRDGRSDWRKNLTRSNSTSSDGSADEESFRGRKKLSKHHKGDDHGISSAALEKQMLEMLDKEAEEHRQSSQKAVSPLQIQNQSLEAAAASRRSSKADGDSSRKLSPAVSTDERRSQSIQRNGDATPSPRISTEQEEVPRTSIEEVDSTAPSSPVANGFFPSISINLSPPTSRSPSPTKKPLPRLTPFRHERSKSKQRNRISAADFVSNGSSTNISRKMSQETDTRASSVARGSRGASPMTKRNSLTPEDSPYELRRIQSAAVSVKRNTKSSNPPESRLRGIFKGGRIAEIVGNEVSRVGDFIWKRDIPSNTRLSSGASSINSDDSDGEYDVGADGLKHKPLAHLRRYPTSTDDVSALSRQTTNSERSKYVPSFTNLPTFTSPFKLDEEERRLKTSGASPEDDHILRQQLAQREQGKPRRFDRLAPPKIDVGGTSPSTPELRQNIDSDRPDSYGFGKAVNFEYGVKGAGRRLNDALGPLGRSDGPFATGLASLDVKRGPPGRRPSHRPSTLAEASRHWSLSTRSLPSIEDSNSTTSKREIARVRALLLSSGVKAREICRRGNSERDPPPTFLLKAREHPNDPTPRVPRSKEHLWAAKHLIHTLEMKSSSFRRALSQFSDSTAPTLHARLRHLDDVVSNTLTPRVRAAADDAGELSSKLTTTSTLAVKQLNDAVDVGVRRRNRRFRWMRRVAYVLLEWVLVGLMWQVWLVVMIWKVIAGTVRGVGRGVKWILWL